jgi:enoyl-CoA hydratase/carnithine racemase
MDPETGVAIQRRSGNLLMTLSTPKSLNALNLASTRKLRKTMTEDKYKITVLNGVGRAFCAGGDVWSVAKNGPEAMDKKSDGLSE